MTSRSWRSRSSRENSGISGSAASALRLGPAAAMPKKSICPSTFCRRLPAMESSSFSLTATRRLRYTPKLSKAPARIRFSTARLFASAPYIRSQKS